MNQWLGPLLWAMARLRNTAPWDLRSWVDVYAVGSRRRQGRRLAAAPCVLLCMKAIWCHRRLALMVQGLSQLARAKCASKAPVRARGAGPGAFRHQPAHALPGLNLRTQRPLYRRWVSKSHVSKAVCIALPSLLSALCPHASALMHLHFALDLLTFSTDLLASPNPRCTQGQSRAALSRHSPLFNLALFHSISPAPRRLLVTQHGCGQRIQFEIPEHARSNKAPVSPCSLLVLPLSSPLLSSVLLLPRFC